MFYKNYDFNQDISNWNIGSLTSAGGMLSYGNSFSTTNYDKLLVGWEGQTHNNDVEFACATKYTAGGEAEAARNRLINDDGWTITDGGAA